MDWKMGSERVRASIHTRAIRKREESVYGVWVPVYACALYRYAVFVCHTNNADRQHTTSEEIIHAAIGRKRSKPQNTYTRIGRRTRPATNIYYSISRIIRVKFCAITTFCRTPLSTADVCNDAVCVFQLCECYTSEKCSSCCCLCMRKRLSLLTTCF